MHSKTISSGHTLAWICGRWCVIWNVPVSCLELLRWLCIFNSPNMEWHGFGGDPESMQGCTRYIGCCSCSSAPRNNDRWDWWSCELSLPYAQNEISISQSVISISCCGNYFLKYFMADRPERCFRCHLDIVWHVQRKAPTFYWVFTLFK